MCCRHSVKAVGIVGCIIGIGIQAKTRLDEETGVRRKDTSQSQAEITAIVELLLVGRIAYCSHLQSCSGRNIISAAQIQTIVEIGEIPDIAKICTKTAEAVIALVAVGKRESRTQCAVGVEILVERHSEIEEIVVIACLVPHQLWIDSEGETRVAVPAWIIESVAVNSTIP